MVSSEWRTDSPFTTHYSALTADGATRWALFRGRQRGRLVSLRRSGERLHERDQVKPLLFGQLDRLQQRRAARPVDPAFLVMHDDRMEICDRPIMHVWRMQRDRSQC